MLNVLGAEYIVTARSPRAARVRLLIRHVLRNAVIPTITVLGINIGFLIGTTVIIEQVFALPGIGQLMIQSIFNRDFTVVQGVTLVFAMMVVAINLLVDPHLRPAGSAGQAAADGRRSSTQPPRFRWRRP